MSERVDRLRCAMIGLGLTFAAFGLTDELVVWLAHPDRLPPGSPEVKIGACLLIGQAVYRWLVASGRATTDQP